MQRIIQHCGTQQEMLRFLKLHEKIVDVVTNLLRKRLQLTNSMVQNLVAIELAYINTKHPDFHEANLFQRSQELEISKNFKDFHVNNESTKDNKKVNTGKISNFLRGQGDLHHADSSQASNPASSRLDSHAHSVKGVNLLSDVPQQTSRKPREQRDCDVIEHLIRSYFLIVKKNIQDTIPKAIMHFLVNFIKDNLQSELVSSLYKREELEFLLEESEHIAQRRNEAIEMLQALQRASQIIGEIREIHLW
nr:dynamin-1-like protein [Crassostrea gigas]